MIIGFSSTVGYACSECQAVCCRSEYQLPLFRNEYENIIANLPLINNFILKDTNEKNSINHWLLRTDSCVFLTNNAECMLHNNNITGKPLICQVYPLIFWKNSQDTLTYLFPCKGLKWVAEKDHQIKNSEQIFSVIKNKFTEYFGDQVDGYNPYEGISGKRVLAAQNNLIFLQNSDWAWSEIINENINNWVFLGYKNLLGMINSSITQSSFQNYKVWLEYLKSAYHWLTYNPLLLALEESESILIRLTAISWGLEFFAKTDKNISVNSTEKVLEIKIDMNRMYEQITWGMVQIITQEWWNDLNPLIDQKFSKGWNNARKELKKIQNLLNF